MGCCPPAEIWSFTSIHTHTHPHPRTHTHTHTHTRTHTSRSSGADEMTMKVKWKWQWNDNYLARMRRGELKRRGTERTPTRHTWPGAGKPWKGKGKEKRRPTDTGQDQRRGGRRKRLNQPNTAKTYAYLGTRRTQPTWRGESTRTHEIGDPWGTS